MSETICDSDFTKYLPQPLTHDPKMIALAKAAASELMTVSGAVENVLIYSRIDTLPEEVVDILAYDFHVDWYDQSYPLEVKRRILKGSVKVHKKMGTKYAVESVLQSLHPDSRIEEWFQYGGHPHCFQVVINADRQEYEINLEQIVRSINLYKRLSSHLEAIRLERRKKGRLFLGSMKCVCVKRNIKINPYNKQTMRCIQVTTGSAKLVYVSVKYHNKRGV